MNGDVIKVCLIGDKTTGKTTIVSRIQSGTFKTHTSCTIGVSFSRLKYDQITYEIWDTAGQERFFALLPMYLRNAQIVIFVCDVSNAKSLSMIDDYVRLLNNLDDYQIIVVGNKTDLMSENEVSSITEIIKQKCSDSVIADRIYDYAYISAKTGADFDIFMDKLYQCATKMWKINMSKNPTIKLDEKPNDKSLCPC